MKILKCKPYHTFKKIKMDFVKDFAWNILGTFQDKHSQIVPWVAFISVDTPYHKIDPH
jgi:hypothetical protein